jgi:hypothetical protein
MAWPQTWVQSGVQSWTQSWGQATPRALLPAMSGVRMSGARMRATGTLSVLFVGGLGLAVLAGPANCPCDRNAVASAEVPDGAPSLSRFTYAIASAEIEQGLPRASVQLAAAPVADEDDLPALSNVAMLESKEPADTPPIATRPNSPITTSAIDTLTTRAANPPSHIGLLPPTQEALPDNAPKVIQLAAAAPAEGAQMAPVLPPVVVDTPLTEIEVVDPDTSRDTSEPAVEKKRPRKHNAHAAPRTERKARQRTTNASTRQKAPVASTKPDRRDKLAKVPKWARQMFDNPWQTKAFSYIQ